MMITLRVNTRTGSVTREELKSEYRSFGSRGLIAMAALDEIPPDCDPLGPENKLLLAQGLLAGTIVTTSGRMSVGAKSPLTRGIKESNVGGMVGKALSDQGIRLLIVEGSPQNGELYILLLRRSGEAESWHVAFFCSQQHLHPTLLSQRRPGCATAPSLRLIWPKKKILYPC